MRVTTLGWVRHKVERVAEVTPRFALCVLVRGGGTFWAAGGAVEVKAPGVFFTSPGMVHDYGPVGGGLWEEMYWILDGARLEEWVEGGWWPVQASFRSLSKGEAMRLTRLFRLTRQALEKRDRKGLDAAKLGIERYLSETAMPQSRPASRLVATIEAWRREPWLPWSQSKAAAQVGMSASLFRRQFTSEFGLPPHQFLLRLRIELATRLLRGTAEPIKAIASRCGFRSTETFIRAFARQKQMTPSKWRAEHCGLLA